MKPKVLFCASTSSHLKNFHLPYMEDFQRRGYEVWTATNSGEAIPFADHSAALPLQKSFLSPQNIQAIFAARRLLLSQGFDCISTHTTLASAVVRAAVLLLPKRKRPRVYCICHGYLFNEADGLKKWVYLLPEKLCARVTDVLMVMNREDHEIAERHKLYRERLVFIHGMGLDLTKFKFPTPQERLEGRERLGFGPDEFLFIYAAEFSKRKNQAMLLEAFAKAAPQIPQARLLLAGTGATLEACKALAGSLGIADKVRFLGHVDHMERLYPLCDAAVSTSRIEGLPFNIMEAMACGLPVIASRIKGHTDLLGEGSGWVFGTAEELARLMSQITTQPHPVSLSENLKHYSLPNIKEELSQITNYKVR